MHRKGRFNKSIHISLNVVTIITYSTLEDVDGSRVKKFLVVLTEIVLNRRTNPGDCFEKSYMNRLHHCCHHRALSLSVMFDL